MARGEKVWAQGWSEPGAGSDLAALRSHTERTDGGWLLTGQKTWSSRAAYAHRLFGRTVRELLAGRCTPADVRRGREPPAGPPATP